MSGQNVKIMGEGSVSGGKYGSVSVFGDGKFVDFVEADSIKVFGSAQLREVIAEEIKVAGSAEFRGRIKAGTLKVSGQMEASEPLKAENIVVNGELLAKGVETEKFISRGSFRLESLNANDISIYLAGRSHAAEIGAETIRVSNRGLVGLFFSASNPWRELYAESIEADDIELERTVCKSVKGNRVRIGPGCKIGTVEYRDSIYIDKTSKVEETLKV